MKFKAGYEMLVSNLLVGLTGSVICIIGIVFIEPVLNSVPPVACLRRVLASQNESVAACQSDPRTSKSIIF